MKLISEFVLSGSVSLYVEDEKIFLAEVLGVCFCIYCIEMNIYSVEMSCLPCHCWLVLSWVLRW